MAGGMEFNGGKFKELVLLLALRSTDDPRMSRVKLNKLLYRSDFEAYRLLGRSITGARYVKGEFGPMAKELPLAEDQLGARGHLTWRKEEEGPHTRKVPEALEGADAALFSPEELAIIDAALVELAPHGGRSASEWSHQESAGWNIVEYGEEIPYSTALISTRPIPDEDVERARQLGHERGWAAIRP